MIRTSEIANLIAKVDPQRLDALKESMGASAFNEFTSFQLGEGDGTAQQTPFVTAALQEAAEALDKAVPKLEPEIQRLKRKCGVLGYCLLAGQILSFLGGATGLATLKNPASPVLIISLLALLGGLLGIVAKFIDSPIGQPALLVRQTTLVNLANQAAALAQRLRLMKLDTVDRAMAEQVLKEANDLCGAILAQNAL